MAKFKHQKKPHYCSWALESVNSWDHSFWMFARSHPRNTLCKLLWSPSAHRMGQSNLLARIKHLFDALIYCHDETYSLYRIKIVSFLVWLFIASPSKNWCEELIPCLYAFQSPSTGYRWSQYKFAHWNDYTSWHKYISVIIVNNTQFPANTFSSHLFHMGIYKCEILFLQQGQVVYSCHCKPATGAIRLQ